MIVEDLLPLAKPIEQFRLLPGNPRRGDVTAVAASLSAFGQRKPIVALPDGTVIAGNHTLQAAQQLGWDEIAVVVVRDDDVTAKAYALADNRTAELGGYDDELLAELIAEVANEDELLFAATGWDIDELADLLEDSAESYTDPDDVPEPPKVAVTKPGDVWLLGPHRVVCGDSTNASAVSAALAGRKADMVWTDPPYGVSYETKAGKVHNDDIGDDALAEMLKAALGVTLTASRPGGAWFVAGPDRHGPFKVFVDLLHDLGVYRQTVLWVKDRFVLGRMDYHCRHEPIFYGWAPGAPHVPPPDRSQDTVWEIDKPKRNADHPTMKPVALITRAVENHTKRGDLVLDPFGGSGSTLIASHDTGRSAVLVELSPQYVDVICRRFQEHTGIVPILESTGQEHDFCE
jgi:DNA modification methylase